MKNAKTLIAGACLLLLATACLVLGEDKKPAKDSLAGTWDCVAHLSGEDDIPFTMTLDQKGEVVTGSVATHEGDLEVKSGTYKSGTLELHLETPDAKYAVTGNLDGDQFKGKWSKDPDGIGGDWEGKRSGPAKSSGQ
jgi:hypothetical protein